MPTRDVVVVAASAGGLEALQALLAGLPGDYAGVLLVVSHIPAQSGDALPKILDRATSLTVANARHGERLRGGHVYVASPDHHLLVGDGHLHVRRGPRENGHRPAADPLFRSAALHFGPRVVGVVLSGTLSDGAAGLVAVRRQGGVTVVQDPGDALFNGMPLSALEAVAVDHVLAAAQMGPLLAALALEDVSSRVAEPDATMRQEVSLMEGNHEPVRNHPGRPSPWPCPDCNGVLWTVEDDDIFRFRCRVGHAWTADALVEAQASEIEFALWAALRALEDRASLHRALAERARSAGRELSADRFAEESEDADRNIAVLREFVQAGRLAPEPEPEHGGERHRPQNATANGERGT
jgi:two-component system chemotaxis response regulator CheB